MIFRGDIISGPVAPVFGPGVLDIDLKALRDLRWVGLIQIVVFFALLLAGFVYIWRKGVLDRPDGEIWRSGE